MGMTRKKIQAEIDELVRIIRRLKQADNESARLAIKTRMNQLRALQRLEQNAKTAPWMPWSPEPKTKGDN